MDYLYDHHRNCVSIMLKMKFPVYRNIIEQVCRNQGGIGEQRGVLWSSTAVKMRKRMINDIVAGAVLPPVVVGAIISDVDFSVFLEMDDDEMVNWLIQNAHDLYLIDGIQRTAAMIEASKIEPLSNYELRLEFWMVKSVNSLIYRMLILNSGRGPWDIRQQLETVFGAVLKQIQTDDIGISICSVDEGQQRRSAKQYQSGDIFELYLAFGSRKEKINIKQNLFDEFVRLDFLDLTANDESIHQFSESIHLMGKLDECFSRAICSENKGHFQNGIEIFSSQPACVGFIVSTAIRMLGRPGSKQSKDDLSAKWNPCRCSLTTLIDRMNRMGEAELAAFLALPILSERLSARKASKAGNFEREFFKAAFTTLYDEGEELGSFKICWNAY